MRIKLICLALLATISSFGFSQSAEEARSVQKQISDYRQQIFNDARAAGKPLSAAELQEKVKVKTEELLKSIDPEKIKGEDALAWSRLYQSLGKDQVACDLAKRFLDTKPSETDMYQAMSIIAQSCNALGEADMLVMTLNDIPVPDFGSSMTIVSMTTNVYIDTIFEKKGLDTAISVLSAIEKKIKTEDPKVYAEKALEAEKKRANGKPSTVSDEERIKMLMSQGQQANENQRFSIANKRAQLYKDGGKLDLAVASLKECMESLDAASPVHRRAKMALTQLTLKESSAPALTIERSYGEFKGLEGLKGKVVIVDFFAHWCGPCIASFPDMKQMYSDLHDKGLEVVGVTTYYGYYKRENVENRDMAKDVEYAKMSEFINEYKLPWTVAYGNRSNFEAYGVSGIPTTILIDKSGKIHSVHVGYSKESFKKFREEVEALVKG